MMDESSPFMPAGKGYTSFRLLAARPVDIDGHEHYLFQGVTVVYITDGKYHNSAAYRYLQLKKLWVKTPYPDRYSFTRIAYIPIPEDLSAKEIARRVRIANGVARGAMCLRAKQYCLTQPRLTVTPRIQSKKFFGAVHCGYTPQSDHYRELITVQYPRLSSAYLNRDHLGRCESVRHVLTEILRLRTEDVIRCLYERGYIRSPDTSTYAIDLRNKVRSLIEKIDILQIVRSLDEQLTRHPSLQKKVVYVD